MWKEITFDVNKAKELCDSGIHMVDYVHQFATDRDAQNNLNFDPDTYRELLQKEVLQFSDDVSRICLTCGKKMMNR